ncbi:double-strand break repair protein AddB [Oceanibacterium hippocampi]|uniref:PD-(D/E)XK nuclease superfamily protein n=1 Tax=Oceanibacterium hippocampi TaxID=745714 RepID=A0A1Y5RTA6_9PROT|nr:double-strand break repair protein AddB [Oceanibacterium hippocampi]SLN22223.1 PD-(D/E)XK nuclease superfamily protein [Oceanibacterium hippocampi]
MSGEAETQRLAPSAAARPAARNVFAIPAHVPFVDALARGLLARHGDDPLTLSRVTLFLPTRRALPALRSAFLRQMDGKATLLPQMRPLGDVDDMFEAPGLPADGPELADLAPPISQLRRLLMLTRLVRARPPSPGSAQAAALAASLARLLDQMQTEGRRFDDLARIVPAELAVHWQEILEFLTIVSARWPEILAEQGLTDPALHRDARLRALASRWSATPPGDPVYAAGSTGSIPATAALLGIIAGLPGGAVVLPGLDRGLDWADAALIAADPAHPQHGMVSLLAGFGMAPEEVRDWHPWPGEEHGAGRTALVAAALLPAAATDRWRTLRIAGDPGLDRVSRIDCPGAREEAAVIALLLRGALETPGRTAALVTPDRGLARRVAAELARWQIDIDDSAGQPLAASPVGSYLRLVAAMAAERAAPVTLLATLKHPLAAGGERPADFRRGVRLLERRLLRGPRPAAGVGTLLTLAREDGDAGRLVPQLERLAAALAPLDDLIARRTVPLGALIDAHLALAEWLAASDQEAGAERLWRGDDGETAADFLRELREAAEVLPEVEPRQWPALFEVLLDGQVVRAAYGRHPRLSIWGPLEARLQQADLLILGALNEGSWPAETSADPWFSAPMRAALGLPPAERGIGLAAHDFQQAMGAPEVVLTRAEKVDGTPTVPSRWLLRLDMLMQRHGLRFDEVRARDLLAWQARQDAADSVRPAAPPAPRPPVAARPTRLSVTRIEAWMKDPYQIFARDILKLKPLDAIAAEPDAAARGSIIHDALDRFVAACPDVLPPDAETRLLALGRDAFGALLLRPAVWGFWWPRYVRIVRWFVEYERERRKGARTLATEVKGRLEIAGGFCLTATADRIDRFDHGTISIVDYKTGSPPSKPMVDAGLAPQLPLEAAIAAAGGFDGIEALPAEELLYIRLGGGEPPGEALPVKSPTDELVAQSLAGLERLVALFADPATPYLCRPRPELPNAFSDYDHLARVREWATPGGDGSEG